MAHRLDIWTVYERPKDYPDKFVARRFDFDRPTSDMFVADTLEEIRKLLPRGLHRLSRDPSDEKQIVEVWL